MNKYAIYETVWLWLCRFIFGDLLFLYENELF